LPYTSTDIMVHGFPLQVADLPADTTKYMVGSLAVGKEYQFQVSAVNAEGRSEPLQTDTTVDIKKQIGTLV